jgi:hypothetical protein
MPVALPIATLDIPPTASASYTAGRYSMGTGTDCGNSDSMNSAVVVYPSSRLRHSGNSGPGIRGGRPRCTPGVCRASTVSCAGVRGLSERSQPVRISGGLTNVPKPCVTVTQPVSLSTLTAARTVSLE